MADINVQHPTLLRRRAAPGSQACDASARMDMADATVMEGHEGCAWGRRVGKGREVCLSWASVPEGESSACVSASVPGRGGGLQWKKGREPQLCHAAANHPRIPDSQDMY